MGEILFVLGVIVIKYVDNLVFCNDGYIEGCF